MRITVVYSPAPREVCELSLALPEGSTAFQAIEASGLLQRFPDLDPLVQGLGIWGRKAGPDQVLSDQDRVEIYRLLKVDPKLARRERFQRQGTRATGLFAKRRPGAKPGY